MRTIKFRAFDDGKMIYENDILHIRNEDNLVLRLARFWSNIRNDSQIMQFTGLHDKNGNEIYEGDIIEADVIGISKITYGNSSKFPCSFCWELKYAMFYLDKEIATVSEIIGNIHETPELLNN